MHGVDPRFRGRRNPDLNKRLPLLRDLTDLRFDEDELQADELTQACNSCGDVVLRGPL